VLEFHAAAMPAECGKLRAYMLQVGALDVRLSVAAVHLCCCMLAAFADASCCSSKLRHLRMACQAGAACCLSAEDATRFCHPTAVGCVQQLPEMTR
jgi:hypothetical protein